MSISQQFRVDVLRENTEAVCATCDAAHGRWAKLLGVRALIHPKLRLQEFVGIYEITQEFISATEKVGGRLGYSIRGTLQSQSKSFVDYQHTLRMSKLAAVLEQETWVAVDAPDEFQVIVDSLTSTESNGIISPSEEASHGSAADLLDRFSDAPESSIAEETPVPDSTMSQTNGKIITAEDTTDPGIQAGTSTTEGGENPTPNNINTAVSTPNPLPSETLLSDAVATKGKKVREKASVKTLCVQGITYHCVNCGLILLKMIAEYMDISNALPSLATEVVHRVAEILKLYNSRSCQLVLGAGAMQVSGLKSITTKHLALASQSISFFYCLIPDIRRRLAAHIPDARKALLLTEIDRVGQDYKVHRDEIHSKLVAIMKERLLVHLKTLPQVAETWNRPDDGDNQPSQYARTLTKEVGLLHKVLSPLLLDSDLRSIFMRIVLLFHSQLTTAFSKLDITTPQSNRRLFRDVHLILSCIHGLPSNNMDATGAQKPGQLDEFLSQRFGSKPPP
jgi:vacuolar protein sorting-associated protein 54